MGHEKRVGGVGEEDQEREQRAHQERKTKEDRESAWPEWQRFMGMKIWGTEAHELGNFRVGGRVRRVERSQDATRD